MKDRLKQAVAITVIIATILAFILFFKNHPEAWQALGAVPKWLLVVLLGLYGVFMISLVLIQSATLKLCKLRLRPLENLLLTIYSSIINYFGPLQSGPGFRAVYLKKKHDVGLKNYTVASLLYYFFFACISGAFLLFGLLGLKLIVLILAGVPVIFMLYKFDNPIRRKLIVLDMRSALLLFLATLFQLSIVVVIYFLELRSIDSSISLSQAIVYTGAANFALFVSLTPGAIGFREAFLLFSQNLHHIDSKTILSASLIDRAIYVVFLGILALLAVAFNAKSRLNKYNQSKE